MRAAGLVFHPFPDRLARHAHRATDPDHGQLARIDKPPHRACRDVPELAGGLFNRPQQGVGVHSCDSSSGFGPEEKPG